MNFSVIVPAYNAESTLPALLDSLSNQNFKDFEVIVVDDFSGDKTCQIARSYPCKLIRLSKNHGPAYCRNTGVKSAGGEILVFTDSDCCVDRNWLATIRKYFSKNDIETIMGRLVPTPSSVLGNSISALGFPAGGSLGFEKIWKVDENGFTNSLSTCNCAVKKTIFQAVGGFDVSFPFPGGEDSLFAYELRKLNYRIKYCPDVLVYHRSRDSFVDFVKWQFKRGVSSYIFSTKVSGKKDFLNLRLWSTGNILRQFYNDKKFLLILILLKTSFFAQLAGFLYGRQKDRYL